MLWRYILEQLPRHILDIISSMHVESLPPLPVLQPHQLQDPLLVLVEGLHLGDYGVWNVAECTVCVVWSPLWVHISVFFLAFIFFHFHDNIFDYEVMKGCVSVIFFFTLNHAIARHKPLKRVSDSDKGDRMTRQNISQ